MKCDISWLTSSVTNNVISLSIFFNYDANLCEINNTTYYYCTDMSKKNNAFNILYNK